MRCWGLALKASSKPVHRAGSTLLLIMPSKQAPTLTSSLPAAGDHSTIPAKVKQGVQCGIPP